MDFGEKIRSLREAKGMTQQNLADQLYVTRQTISKWEVGSRYPDLLTTKNLADILGTTIDELVSDEKTYMDERQALLEKTKRDRIAAMIYPVIFLFSAVPLLLHISSDFGYCLKDAFDLESYSDFYNRGLWALMIIGQVMYLVAVISLVLYGIYCVLRKELNIRNVAIIGIVNYAYTGIFALYMVFAPFTLSAEAQNNIAEGVILYVASGVLVLACLYGTYVTYGQFIAGKRQNSLAIVILNIVIFSSMIINYVTFVRTRLVSYMEILFHYGCVLSVFLLLSLITVLVNKRKTIAPKQESVIAEIVPDNA